jgi:hypothetical protein
MYRRRAIDCCAVVGFVCLSSIALAQSAPDEGRHFLLTRSYIRGLWTASSYERLWSAWGERFRPTDFDAQLRVRYGLHPAPYDNDGLLMGFRRESNRRHTGHRLHALSRWERPSRKNS